MTTRIQLGLLCLAAAIPGQVSPAPDPPLQLPNTRVAALFGEWIHLCQAPSLARLTQWMTANLAEDIAKLKAPQDFARDDLDFCTENGGVKAVEVVESTPQSLSLRAVGLKSGLWFQLSRGVNDAGKLSRAGAFPTFPAERSLPKDLSDASVAREVRSSVAKLSRAGLFSGVVTVARDSQIIVTVSAGYADRAQKTPITGATQFTLGSMGKLFTAASIGQLVDQGKMSLSDTVGKFFPAYPNQTVRDRVTVDMLLSHTAGMGDFLDKRTPSMMKSGVKRAAEFMPLYDHDEPKFAPGSSWSYSNAGLALAGAIVEEVSGEDYPDYLRRHVFTVAGMANSDPNNMPHTSAALVTPYTKMGPTGRTPDWHEAEHDIGSPAGGAISTTDDLLRFADGLRTGKLMSRATFEVMTKPNARSPNGYPYGDAFEVENIYGQPFIGHGGGFPGVNTYLRILLNAPYTVVVLSNLDPPAAAYAGSVAVALVAAKAKSGK